MVFGKVEILKSLFVTIVALIVVVLWSLSVNSKAVVETNRCNVLRNLYTYNFNLGHKKDAIEPIKALIKSQNYLDLYKECNCDINLLVEDVLKNEEVKKQLEN